MTTKRRHRSVKSLERTTSRKTYEIQYRPEASGLRVVCIKRLRNDSRVWERHSRWTYSTEAAAQQARYYGSLEWTRFYRVN